MVKRKRETKPKSTPDFRKEKHRVGKRFVRKNQTSFESVKYRDLYIQDQKMSEAESQRKFDEEALTDACSCLFHHNMKSRSAALSKMNRIILQGGTVFLERASSVVSKITPLLIDPDQSARQTAAKLLFNVVKVVYSDEKRETLESRIQSGDADAARGTARIKVSKILVSSVSRYRKSDESHFVLTFFLYSLKQPKWLSFSDLITVLEMFPQLSKNNLYATEGLRMAMISYVNATMSIMEKSKAKTHSMKGMLSSDSNIVHHNIWQFPSRRCDNSFEEYNEEDRIQYEKALEIEMKVKTASESKDGDRISREVFTVLTRIIDDFFGELKRSSVPRKEILHDELEVFRACRGLLSGIHGGFFEEILSLESTTRDLFRRISQEMDYLTSGNERDGLIEPELLYEFYLLSLGIVSQILDLNLKLPFNRPKLTQYVHDSALSIPISKFESYEMRNLFENVLLRSEVLNLKGRAELALILCDRIEASTGPHENGGIVVLLSFTRILVVNLLKLCPKKYLNVHSKLGGLLPDLLRRENARVIVSTLNIVHLYAIRAPKTLLDSSAIYCCFRSLFSNKAATTIEKEHLVDSYSVLNVGNGAGGLSLGFLELYVAEHPEEKNLLGKFLRLQENISEGTFWNSVIMLYTCTTATLPIMIELCGSLVSFTRVQMSRLDANTVLALRGRILHPNTESEKISPALTYGIVSFIERTMEGVPLTGKEEERVQEILLADRNERTNHDESEFSASIGKYKEVISKIRSKIN